MQAVESNDRRVKPGVLASYAVVGAFLVFCGYYIYHHRQDFAFAASMSAAETVTAGLLVLVSYIINIYQLNLFLRKFGISSGLMELTAMTNGMILGNLVLPMRGGSGALALYLKRVHRLDFQAFAAIYGGTALLMSLINTALALVALAFLAVVYGFTQPALTLFVGFVLVCCVYLGIFPPPVRWKSRGILGAIFAAANSWHLLARDRSLLIGVTASMLAISLALASAFYFIYRAMGMPLNPSAVLITSSLGNIANLVPLTPGSLGIFDAVTIQIPQMFGLDPARSIAGTLVFRVLAFSWALILGGPGMIHLAGASRSGPAE